MKYIYYVNAEILGKLGACGACLDICGDRDIKIVPDTVKILFRDGQGRHLDWLARAYLFKMQWGDLRARIYAIAARLGDIGCEYGYIGDPPIPKRLAKEAADLLNECGDIITRYKQGER